MKIDSKCNVEDVEVQTKPTQMFNNRELTTYEKKENDQSNTRVPQWKRKKPDEEDTRYAVGHVLLARR